MTRRRLATFLMLATVAAGAAAVVDPPGAAPIVAPADRRGEDQTFLTYPEWFLVYSPDEYADHLAADAAPSAFPYVGHLRQFWQAYSALADRVAQTYEYNGEYHTMIAVIGVSTTIEYAIKAGYELVVGRITEATRGETPTAEDALAAEVARDYVDFLDRQPWYEYDYGARLRQLWALPAFGPDLLRKWERRYFLTTEFAAKALYAKAIGFGAASSFDKPRPETVAVLSGLAADAALPDGVRRIEVRGDGLQVLALTRYQPFTPQSLALARAGGRFVEIAGNRDAILVTARVPAGWQPGADVPALLFRQPILTRPTQERIAVAVPVARLDALLHALSTAPVELEHVYDY